MGNSEVKVPEITVFGAASRSSTLDFVPTVSEMSGTRLSRKKQSTLGETLSREAGVTSSQFGPNASRPIIRGLEGDRVRILQNGMGVLDASTASPDHGVAVDPLVVERVEIVRGAAALLYGGNAVGGVVNMVTIRIPEKKAEPFRGQAATRFSSHDMGRSAGVAIESGVGDHWAVHADGSIRGADDYRVPGFARTEQVREAEPLEPEHKGRVYNSFNRTNSQAAGVSRIFDTGFLGASVSNFNSVYGTVAERPVKIKMLQQRFDLAGEAKQSGFIKSIRAKTSYSHYKHVELDEGVAGTTFNNDGGEARIDVKHQDLAGWTGLFGAQANVFQFSAEGDESFLPKTNNQSYSAFVYEEIEKGDFRPSLGARLDSVTVKSATDDQFGPGRSRSFTAGSVALGFLYQLSQSHSVVVNGAYTERAPTYEELFANGRHVATAQNIVGDSELKPEKGQSVEISWRHKSAASQASVGVFLQDFKNFIALQPTGVSDGDPDEPFEIFDHKSVTARLYGAEAEYRHKLPALFSSGTLEIEFKGDLLRGMNRDSGDSLPRMTPSRESVGLIYRADKFQADLEVQRSEKQTKLAPNESKTEAYTVVNLGAEMPVRLNRMAISAFVRVNNVFDAEARNHVSVLKDIAPLPGRSLTVGLEVNL